MTNFEMSRGDDKKYRITVTDKITKLPVNITGCTLTMTWRKTYTDTVFLQKTFTLTAPAEGIAEVSINAADTNTLPAGERTEFLFDVEILDTSALKETIADGKFVVKPDITYS
jgi:hypothetical protein